MVKKSIILSVISLIAMFLFVPSVAAGDKDDAIMKKFTQLGFSEEEIENMPQEAIDRLGGSEGELVSRSERYFKVTINKLTNEVQEMVEFDKETALQESAKLNAKEKELQEKINRLEMQKQEIITKSKAINNSAHQDAEKSLDEIDKQLIQLQYAEQEYESSGWIGLTGYVSHISGDEYAFKNSYEWLNGPAVLLKDVIGISHSEDWSIIPNSLVAKAEMDIYWNGYKDDYGGCDCTSRKSIENDYYYSTPHQGPNGMAVNFNLQPTWVNSRYEDGRNYEGYIAYRVDKANTSVVESNIYGSYSHQIVVASPSISIYPGGIGVTPALSYSDADTVNVQFDVQ
ncbi:hypothetical protein SAMN04487944_10272 [Gracilibacillus ureilyticus]|uniref:N-terminal domain of peptidoglycan hydrolase CwlO-containing protein n=1 Tax=Gracilibacillus ureilyticus TaxID=531814 RepID=A0A1H9MNH9_9BACI|nr:hypothetical protein [Gracilibacillus ureilyticus]SER25131.1 hypothetical protein SAMN04487944_10272 [Gracilibacillus ureilyticus]